MLKASDFWVKYRERDTYRQHICDIPKEIFYARHKNVLKLVDMGHDPISIGLLLAGKYYHHVWNSRSCSGYLAELVGVNASKHMNHIASPGEYMAFYCNSSSYFDIMTHQKAYPDLIEAFGRADQMDELGGL